MAAPIPLYESMTEEARAAALAALIANGGNVKKTARDLGMNRSTLINWRDDARAVSDTIAPDVKARYVRLWAAAQEQLVSRMSELAPASDSLRDVAYAANIALAGYLDSRDGRRGAQDSNTVVVPVQVVVRGYDSI